ncbi:FAD-dependent monooxygenase [Kibdelosporangium aridum]|uniref:FAD-dependent monooxygenase n=1 Tax=Kibdelosporangium aridum TaxID=2030 RepID=UPI0005267F27
MTRNVTVVGAGSAGATLALALRHAGIPCEVYENDPGPAEGEGHLLSIGSNAVDALQAIDVTLTGAEIPHLPAFTGGGTLMGVIPNGVRNAPSPTSLLINRERLRRDLQNLCAERGVPIHYGKKLISCSADSATAVFDDGTEVSADLLVGADGQYSRTRAGIFPEAANAQYTGILGLGGVSHSDKLEPTPNAVVNVFGHKGFLSYYVWPDGAIDWLAFAPRDQRPTPDEVANMTTQQWREWLVGIYAKDMWQACEVIEGIHGPVDINPMENIVGLTAWYRRSAVLIGDAAATTGRIGAGGGMAMEGAVALAKCLRDVSDTQQALATYQKLRQARVDRVVKWGRRNARPPEVRTPIGMHLRAVGGSMLLRWFPRLASLDFLYGHHIDWDERVTAAS